MINPLFEFKHKFGTFSVTKLRAQGLVNPHGAVELDTLRESKEVQALEDDLSYHSWQVGILNQTMDEQHEALKNLGLI